MKIMLSALFNKKASNEKKSKRQLEKQLKNGKDLLVRLSQKLSQANEEKRQLKEQLKSAYTYLAAIIYWGEEVEN